ncbi:hypothetical protein EGW08_001358 [Elysia chlorotica]|uniref:Uncharacterized protein n=1 Tax=Elysia chlorotica TaxID=188477 RepID=A0A3S1A518_ELYCH|nr:hypothetical protein EGW08_001358 [Elysia chlorotica]
MAVNNNSCDAATLPVPVSNNKPVRATRKKSQRSQAQDNTATVDLPTQVISDEGDTMPVKEGVDEGKNEDDTEEKTQVFAEETVAVEDVVGKSSKVSGRTRNARQGKRKPPDTEPQTVPVEDSNISGPQGDKALTKKSNPISLEITDTLVIGENDSCGAGQDEPTQLFSAALGQEKDIEKNKDENNDEPTQDFANSSSDLPTQVFSPTADADSPRNKLESPRKKAGEKGKKNIQPVFSDEDEDDTNVKPWMAATANDPTQAYCDNDVEEDTDEVIKNYVNIFLCIDY